MDRYQSKAVCLQVGIIGVGPHVERSILQNTLATLQGLRTAVHRCPDPF